MRNPLPPTQIEFPINYLIRVVPQPVTEPIPAPDLSGPVKRRRYLAAIAACGDCHTPMKQGRPLPGLQYSGGQIFEGPWGRVASANITPDPSGISYYDETTFIQVMRTGYVKARVINQIMHHVDNTEPPMLCGASHGAGNSN